MLGLLDPSHWYDFSLPGFYTIPETKLNRRTQNKAMTAYYNGNIQQQYLYTLYIESSVTYSNSTFIHSIQRVVLLTVTVPLYTPYREQHFTDSNADFTFSTSTSLTRCITLTCQKQHNIYNEPMSLHINKLLLTKSGYNTKIKNSLQVVHEQQLYHT